MARVEGDGVVPMAVKPGEDGQEGSLAVRLWNLSDTPVDARVSFGAPIRAEEARRTTHLETPIGTALVDGGALIAPVAARGMATYGVSLARRAGGDGSRIYLPAAALS